MNIFYFTKISINKKIMSVSEGLKKIVYKSFHVTLKKIDIYGNVSNPPQSLSHKIKIQPWTRVKDLKSIISSVIGVTNKSIRLFYQNIELMDELTMFDYKIVENKKPEINFQIQNKRTDFFIRVYGTFHCHLILQKIMEEIMHGFMQGLIPQLIQDGTSGTYKMRNVDKEVVGIFKPFDEEPFAPNNQKGYVNQFGSETFRKGILSGEGAIREFAAFALDEKGLFDVPPTTFVEVMHPSFNKVNMEMLQMNSVTVNEMKGSIVHNFLMENIVQKTNSSISTNSTQYNSLVDDNLDYAMGNSKYNFITKKYGSLQKFIKCTDVAANFSFSLYTIEEAQKIGVLDLRILNCDRNDENVLVIKKKHKTTGKPFYKLVPIDHSLSFPDCLKIYDYELCWMGWDQAQQPFTDKLKAYIQSIDIVADMERLSKTIKLREDCWKMFRISNTVLKVGAEYDLNLYEIGNLMYKLDYKNDSPSQIEILIEKTDNLCSIMRVDKRLRIFSVNEEKEDVVQVKRRKMSLLKRTTSEPKLNQLDDDDESENLKPKDNVKLKRDDDIVFDSPYNEMYFHHFEAFLIELIKKTYPSKINNKVEESTFNK